MERELCQGRQNGGQNHRWLIESPDPEDYKSSLGGTCKRCGQSRQFSNEVQDALLEKPFLGNYRPFMQSINAQRALQLAEKSSGVPNAL